MFFVCGCYDGSLQSNIEDKIYKQLFQQSDCSPHQQLIPTLADVHYLKTYYKLANDALYKDLVIDFKPTDLPTLQFLVRETQILESCQLLQQLLGICSQPVIPELEIENFLLSVVKTQKILGYRTWIENVQQQFPEVREETLQEIASNLCQGSSVTVLNPYDVLDQKIICYKP